MAILSALLVGCDGRETEADSPPSALVADSTADPAVLLNRDHFGFDSTRFAFREAVIKRNQTFSDLLSEAGVPRESIRSYRAGNFGASNLTWQAMAQAGLTLSSNYNPCYFDINCEMRSPDALAGLFRTEI